MAGTLIDRIAEILHRYNMLAAGDRAGIAVSGGADSVALLHLMQRLARPLSVSLVVLHMNHQLRGTESDLDEQFVRELAASLGLAVVVSRQARPRGNLEAGARQLRREFFQSCRASEQLARIALGHTRSDQAETVLHRILRGSGLTGQAAMRPVTADGLIRPLLTISREEVRGWARGEQLSWREDSSNRDLRFTRNRLRMETLPALTREFNPNLERLLAASALRAQAEEDYLAAILDEMYPKLARTSRLGILFAVRQIAEVPLALRRRLMRRALAEIRAKGLAGLTFDHIESVLALCDSVLGHERVHVPGADALRSFEWLLLTAAGRLAAEPCSYHCRVELDEAVDLPFGRGVLYLTRARHFGTIYDKFKTDQKNGVEEAFLAERSLHRGQLQVRNWEAGDTLHRPDHRSTAKVKVLLQEKRVPLWERRQWPVLVSGKEVAWVRSLGISQRFAACEGDQDAVRLIFQPAGQ